MSKRLEPKLRTVKRHQPPFPLNEFPSDFGYKLAREVVYLLATKDTVSLEGGEWEKIFATCIGADWKPSNVGLDDVVLDNCAWGAKSIKKPRPSAVAKVRLIAGRNSTVYSFGATEVVPEDTRNLGAQVLEIWNERVSSLRRIHKHLRTVVLIKGVGLQELALFEFDTVRYDPDLYLWEWNKNKILIGRRRSDGVHCFTWQPTGTQFTIIEDVPAKCLLVSIQPPDRLDKDAVLKSVGFNKSWVSVVRRGASP